ncbi:baculoviral IAP repeat-containing protein 5-like [Homarus americanus]|uniref:Baculoviral IAP repeat-containing protein 5-like n=1 Tax=Homarus americanus TaxID=6706 RepID=A0A8J5K9G5_HOMAM|nr:baculoviral IAP repeat-containing protein 5-like [Homarus americanus]KAG7166974.1 baculoviral IAP repeat-containing protein 5-like [Homarus americanus]
MIKDKDLVGMRSLEKRLKSFKKWPFDNEMGNNKEKMAEAGFYFIGSKREPDLVRCFMCLKELDGWEEEDVPWQEHEKHAPYCQFVQLNKPESEITFLELHQLEMHQVINVTNKLLAKKIGEFKKQCQKTRETLETLE